MQVFDENIKISARFFNRISKCDVLRQAAYQFQIDLQLFQLIISDACH